MWKIFNLKDHVYVNLLFETLEDVIEFIRANNLEEISLSYTPKQPK